MTSAPSPTSGNRPLHAVVIGAGVDGLAAAQALSRHIERVTLVERGDVPDPVAPRSTAPATRQRHALRCVLESPQVVVRAGLEAVGLVVEGGRVRAVEVRSRRSDAAGSSLVIDADLVVDAGGPRAGPRTPAPDGLVVLDDAQGTPGPSGDRGISIAAYTAAVLGRCLAVHLSRNPDLRGFSAFAQRAIAQARARANRPAVAS